MYNYTLQQLQYTLKYNCGGTTVKYNRLGLRRGAMQERILGVLKALSEKNEDVVWHSLNEAHQKGKFRHRSDVDPAAWQQWWYGVVRYLS
jgi:hypothetical protein